jgi:hypothetical protein
MRPLSSLSTVQYGGGGVSQSQEPQIMMSNLIHNSKNYIEIGEDLL